MSERKYTPGPWTVEETDETYWIGTARANTHKVGEVIIGMDHGPYTDEAEARILANAHLIAAAPDLLEALQAIVRRVALVSPYYEMAQAAIAKAEGLRSELAGEETK